MSSACRTSLASQRARLALSRRPSSSCAMKLLSKSALELAATGVMLLPLVCYRLACQLLGPSRVFPGCSQGMSLIPGFTGQYLRRAFYRWVLPRCGRGSVVSFGTVFSHSTAQIGEHAYIGLF